MNKSGHTILILIPILLFLIMVIGGVIYWQRNNLFPVSSTSPHSIGQNTATEISTPSKTSGQFVAIYEDDDDNIFGLGQNGVKTLLIKGEVLGGILPSKKYFISYNEDKDKSFLRTIEGKIVNDYDGTMSVIDSISDSESLIYHAPPGEPKFSEVAYEVWDLPNKKLIKKIPNNGNFPQMLVYNGNVLFQKILENRTENENVELILYEGSNSSPRSLGNFLVGSASSISVPSNDSKKLAISDQTNLFIFDFTNENLAKITNYTDEDLLSMQFMTWSPDDKMVAFETEKELFESSIGIVDLDSKKISYIDIVSVFKALGRSDLDVLVFSPEHWFDNENLLVEVEAMESPENKVLEYLKYNLKSGSLTPQPQFKNLVYPEFL